MYLHIGNEIVVPFKEIIAILNLNTTGRGATSEFLNNFNAKIKKDHQVTNFKSCIITAKEIYYSTISSGTLMKRAASILRQLEEE